MALLTPISEMTETSGIVLAAVNVNPSLLDGATVFTQHSDLIRGTSCFSPPPREGRGDTASRAPLPIKDVPFNPVGNQSLARRKDSALM